MHMARGTRNTIFASALALLAACTVHKADPQPALTGPSELGTMIIVSVSPDVLTQDGASQSLVTITARDANGQPLRNLSLRAEITVNGLITDFGTLSARNVVTDGSGRATLIYTAPAAPAIAVDNFTTVSIFVAPSGTDFQNATFKEALIRLVPPGTVGLPNDLAPVFTSSPALPNEDTNVIFDASGSIAANPNSTIVSYTWDFGDGASGVGRQTSHEFAPGNYTVTLTIKDSINRSGSTRQNVTVAPTGDPSPSFVISPNPAPLNAPTHFDASGSTAAVNHRIVAYTWNFGDGSPIETRGDPRIDHTFTSTRTFIVVLTVTDDNGKTKSSSGTAVTPQ